MTKAVSKESTDGKAHSVLGASSSHRWIHCPASVAMSQKVPSPPSSSYAMEGTAAHELAELSLTKKVHPRKFKGKKICGFVVTEEMIEAVEVYVNLITEENLGVKVEIEKRFNLSWLYPGMFGTNDASSISKRVLRVYDYKHGAGIAVDAVDNSQLVYYAIGASYDYKTKGYRDDIDEVEMVIVQPRAYHHSGPIRRWRITFDEMKQWAQKLVVAADMTTWEDAPMYAGDHCRFCPAAGVCPKLYEQSQLAAKTDFGEVDLPDPTLLTEEEIGKVVNAASMVEAFLKKCKEVALNKMLEGTKIPGTKLVKGRSSRIWADESVARTKLAPLASFDELHEIKLKSPSKLEKILDKDIIKELQYKKEGALTIAPSSDKRKEVNINPALDFKEN